MKKSKKKIENIGFDMLNSFIDENYKIQNEFIYYYHLDEILFDKNLNIKNSKDDINYEIVRIVYEEIDWQLYKINVSKIFQKLWQEFGLRHDNKNKIFDLITNQFILFLKNINRIIYNEIYIEIIKLTATNIYEDQKELNDYSKIRNINKFIKDFNKSSFDRINKYANEFRLQIMIIKISLSSKNKSFSEIERIISEYNKTKKGRLGKKTEDFYRTVLENNEEIKIKTGKDNFRRSVFNSISPAKRDIIKYVNSHYNKFMIYIKRNNIKTLNDFNLRVMT